MYLSTRYSFTSFNEVIRYLRYISVAHVNAVNTTESFVDFAWTEHMNLKLNGMGIGITMCTAVR